MIILNKLMAFAFIASKTLGKTFLNCKNKNMKQI
jgi:hypothetical protein